MAKLIRSEKLIEVKRIPVHPEVVKRVNKWDRIETLLLQDEHKIKESFCRQLPNESRKKFELRKKTFNDTFVNITQDLVTAPINSVFSQGIKIDYKSKSTSVIAKFNENVTRSNEPVPIRKYMKDFVGMSLRAYGSICTIIDKPNITTLNAEHEKAIGLPYITSIRLQDVVNWELDSNGSFEWFIYRKTYSPPWANPFLDQQPMLIELECMYTKTDYIVREVDGHIIPKLSYTHGWGFVPVVIQGSFVFNQNDILGNAAMFQSSHSIINMNNNLNVGNYELYKHGGSLLLMPEEAMTGMNLETNKQGDINIKKHDNDGMLPYAGEMPPSFLVKDIRSGEFMDWAIAYQKFAVENERDLKSIAKKGTSGEMVQESGFAKMVDREPLEANLISLSEDIVTYYTKVTNMVALIMDKDNDSTIECDTDYDLRSEKQKYEELELAIKNKVEAVSPTLFREHYKNIAPIEVRNADTLNKINGEIDSYEPDAINKEIEDELNNEFNLSKKNEGEK